MASSIWALSACGFKPLHGGIKGRRINASLAAVAIQAPQGRSGQLLLEALTTTLNPGDQQVAPLYELSVALNRKSEALAIQLDDTVTRFDLLIEARYVLRQKDDNETLQSGVAGEVTSYNVVREPFATLVSEQDSERRAMNGLAVQIRNQLAVYFDSQLP